MKPIHLALIPILLAFTYGCCGCFDLRNAVKGSGVSMTEDRELATFTGIELAGAYGVSITCGEEQSFTITGDDNILPLIITEVRGSTLHVKSEKEINIESPLTIVISCNSLNEISAAGFVNLDIAGVDSDRFDIELNGAGILVASGRARNVDLSVAGTASIDTDGLEAETVSVTINGAGRAGVNASSALEATINGTGTIEYSGDPESVSQQVSGLGVIKRK